MQGPAAQGPAAPPSGSRPAVDPEPGPAAPPSGPQPAVDPEPAAPPEPEPDPEPEPEPEPEPPSAASLAEDARALQPYLGDIAADPSLADITTLAELHGRLTSLSDALLARDSPGSAFKQLTFPSGAVSAKHRPTTFYPRFNLLFCTRFCPFLLVFKHKNSSNISHPGRRPSVADLLSEHVQKGVQHRRRPHGAALPIRHQGRGPLHRSPGGGMCQRTVVSTFSGEHQIKFRPIIACGKCGLSTP